MKNNITRHRITLFAIVAMAASVAFAQTERMVCDETCETEFHKAVVNHA